MPNRHSLFWAGGDMISICFRCILFEIHSDMPCVCVYAHLDWQMVERAVCPSGNNTCHTHKIAHVATMYIQIECPGCYVWNQLYGIELFITNYQFGKNCETLYRCFAVPPIISGVHYWKTDGSLGLVYRITTLHHGSMYYDLSSSIQMTHDRSHSTSIYIAQQCSH